MLILIVVLSCLIKIESARFERQWESFDAYGIKLAANDFVIAEARNDFSQFILQFGPFDSDNISKPCLTAYPGLLTGDVNFIYNIAVGKQINASNTPTTVLVFAGENYNAVNSSKKSPFIGKLTINSTTLCAINSSVRYFAPLNSHEEYSVLGVDPSGKFAYGFGRYFHVIYNLEMDSFISPCQNDSSFWPNSSHFLPHAIDISDKEYAVVAGFTQQNATGAYKPVIHLLRVNATTVRVVDTWEYSPKNGAWQSELMNWDANLFHSKYTMSVAINSNTEQVIVGMQSINTVFQFEIDVQSNKLIYLTNKSTGKWLGYGKSVAWLNEGSTMVILGNQYSFHYKWISSNVYLYNNNETTMKTTRPFFPTNQMPTWDHLDQVFVSMVTTSAHIVILDDNGQVYVIRSTPAGYYSLTTAALGQNPTFSSVTPCPPGTHKTRRGLELCSLCPVGTANSLYALSTSCTPYSCSNTSFCPLGSIVNDTYATIMSAVNQAVSYPKTSASNSLDDIIMEHVFSLGDSPRCLVLSPLFWALLLASITSLILITMGLLKFSSRSHKVRQTIKCIFQKIDLVKDGEFWVGGLASFSLIIILILSYYFSYAFLNQYPIESVSSATFTCDRELRNSKFSTSVQSLFTPHSDEERPVFDLLNEQEFVVTVDFVNTLFDCNHVEVQRFLHSINQTVESNCTRHSEQSMLSVSVHLTGRSVHLQYDFNGINSIGGLRVSLTGASKNFVEHNTYRVRKVKYTQPFYAYKETLAHNPTIRLTLTKVINATELLHDHGEHKFVGLWVPFVSDSIDDLFLNQKEYEFFGLSTTVFTLIISESTFYIWNEQVPIAGPTEIVFHDLLFTIVCLELFGLGYLAAKILLLPLFKLLQRCVEKPRGSKVKPIESTSGQTTVMEPNPVERVSNEENDVINQEPIQNDAKETEIQEEKDIKTITVQNINEEAPMSNVKSISFGRNVRSPQTYSASVNIETTPN